MHTGLTGLALTASVESTTGEGGERWGFWLCPAPYLLLGRAESEVLVPGALGLNGQPPDGSHGMDHESLRFSFSEQRVSLNCL